MMLSAKGLFIGHTHPMTPSTDQSDLIFVTSLLILPEARRRNISYRLIGYCVSRCDEPSPVMRIQSCGYKEGNRGQFLLR